MLVCPTTHPALCAQELLEPLEAAGIVVPRPLEALSAAIETFVVVEREQRVLACAQLTPIGPSENGAFQKVGEVAAFCVHPDFRGTGRGDSLLDWVEQDARCQGAFCRCCFFAALVLDLSRDQNIASCQWRHSVRLCLIKAC